MKQTYFVPLVDLHPTNVTCTDFLFLLPDLVTSPGSSFPKMDVHHIRLDPTWDKNGLPGNVFLNSSTQEISLLKGQGNDPWSQEAFISFKISFLGLHMKDVS